VQAATQASPPPILPFFATKCATEQTTQTQQPNLNLYGKKELPLKEITSIAARKAAYAQFQIFKKEKLLHRNKVDED
jgi:hypothetical protein